MIPPRVLTIAGSDSSGGAGIQADLKTFTVFRTYGMSAITALTAQNTRGVSGILPVAPEFVREQIDAVASDVGVDATKTGMLATREIIVAVADAVRAHRLDPLVVDPVMVAQSGARLLADDARDALLAELLPLAAVVTPNLPEAEALLDVRIADLAAMRDAARRLVDRGARAALVKGGHLDGGDAIDVLHDGRALHELRAPRIATPHTHGTGCMTAAALTACLARGQSLLDAAHTAKRFITTAITHGLALGHGHGPANPLVWLEETAATDEHR
jgi:hydroxymethylpyrimidine/phosphomethylpyrimidine kinase